jgi:hypothetical protein
MEGVFGGKTPLLQLRQGKERVGIQAYFVPVGRHSRHHGVLL